MIIKRTSWCHNVGSVSCTPETMIPTSSTAVPVYVVFYFILIVKHTRCIPVATVSQLRKFIKLNYVEVEPFVLTGNAVRLNVSFGLSALTKFSEVDGELSSLTFATFEWFDPQIHWNPADYDGIENITLYPSEIWTPIIAVVNQVDTVSGIGKGVASGKTFKVRAHSSGKMTWMPGDALTTACSVDVTYFPEDAQTCRIELYSWGYTDDEIKLVCLEDAIDFSYFSPSGEWDVLDSSCSEKEFILKIKRKSVYYSLNIILPVFILGIVNVFSFLIPVKSGETLSFSVTMFLSLVLFLTIVGQQLPRTSDHVSLLFIYLIIDIIHSSCIIIVTILIQRRHYMKHEDIKTLSIYQENIENEPISRKSLSTDPLPGKCSSHIDVIAFSFFLLWHLFASIGFFVCITYSASSHCQ